MAKSVSELAHLGSVVQRVRKDPVDGRQDQKQIISWHNKAVKAAIKQLAAAEAIDMSSLSTVRDRQLE